MFEKKEDRRFRSDENIYILTVQGINIYTLFYMMCICGKLGKIEMLKSNLKVTGVVLGLLLGFQNIIQGLFLENIIDRFLNTDLYKNPDNFYVVSSANSLCTILAFLCIYKLVVKEMKELKAFGRMSTNDQRNTNVADILKNRHSSIASTT